MAGSRLSLISVFLFTTLLMTAWPSTARAQLTAINNGSTVEIDAHSVCRKVTNSTGARIMVPHRTAAEWSSFRSGAPGGVSFATCVPPCGGTSIGGFCWYTAPDQNCDTACSGRGGYNAGTRTYAGDLGSNGQCHNVMSPLIGAGNYASQINNDGNSGEGCVYYHGYTCDGANRRGYRQVNAPTTSGAVLGGRTRVCACNN